MKKLKLNSINAKQRGQFSSFSESMEENVDLYVSNEVFDQLLRIEKAQSTAAILASGPGKIGKRSAVRMLIDDRLHTILYGDTHIGVKLFGKKHYKDYLKFFQKKYKLKSIAVLFAHGEYDNGRWVYYDEEDEQHDVQGWIEKHDGKYGCLILFSCNGGSVTPESSESLLVVPDEVLSGGLIVNDKCHLSLIDPYLNEVNEYTLESDLRKLRAEVLS